MNLYALFQIGNLLIDEGANDLYGPNASVSYEGCYAGAVDAECSEEQYLHLLVDSICHASYGSRYEVVEKETGNDCKEDQQQGYDAWGGGFLRLQQIFYEAFSTRHQLHPFMYFCSTVFTLYTYTICPFLDTSIMSKHFQLT